MATKAWEIDFGDVEKALNLKEQGPPPPPVQDLNSPDPGRDHLTQQLQQAAAQRFQEMNSPDPGRAALTQQMDQQYQWDKIGQGLGLGDAEQLSAPLPLDSTNSPDPGRAALTQQMDQQYQWDEVAKGVSSPSADLLTTPTVDTGPSPLDTQQAAQSTITSPIVTGQERFDSAGQAPPGGIIDTVGAALASPLAAIASTPGYRAMNERNKDAIAAATADGSVMTPMESVKQGVWSALGVLGLGADAVKTTEIPGLGITGGQLAKVLVGTSDKVYDAPTLGGQLSQIWGDITSGVQQWQGVNRQIAALPDAVKPDASMAMLNVYSGYDVVQSTLNDIVNKDANIASIIDRARQAQNVGDYVTAANLGAQALKLKNTSAVEMVDNRTSLLPELGYTLVLDPLNAVDKIFKLAGLTPEALRASKAARLFDVTPTEALERIPGAVADAVGAADIVKGGGNLLSWWEKVNPFARTAEALAAKDNSTLYRMAASLFGDVSTKADAQAIVTALVERPEDLVKGLYNLTSEGLAARADKAGRVAFDAGVVANDEVLDAMKVLQLGADRLKQMASLAGEGGLNKLEFLSEFDDIIADAARRTYGLDKLLEMPVGTKSVKIITEGKNSFVQFLDAAGREAGRSAAMTADIAKAKLKDLNNAINVAGKGDFNLLRDAAQAQRAIMSEIWLNMRPGHWATNAISAYTHLFVDGLYTFKKTDDIVDDLMQLTGGLLPSGRVAEAVQGGETVQSLFRKIPIIGRPLGAFSELGAQIKGGNMSLFGRLAVGEQNFYMRAYHTAFRRVFNQQWERTVTRQMGDVFAKLGVDPAIAKNLTDLAIEAASTGGKQEMIAKFRQAVNAAQTSFTLKQFGIAAEDISPEGQRLLRQMFESGPASVSDAIAQVNKIFRDESRRYQEILRQSAPEAGRYAFTTLENMQDGADIVDDLGRAAKKAGIDPAGIPQQLTKQVTDTEQAIYNSLFYELGGTTEPAQLHIAIDMWGQLHEAKQAVRQRLGALADETIKQGTDQAWAQYFATARQEWDNYSKLAQQIGDQARLDIQSGQAVQRRYDAWEMIEAYSMSDEADLLALRQQGFDVGKTADQQERFKRILAAQRRFVDNYVAQTYSIFNRYPSLDSLDIVVSAQRDVDRLGAQAAAHVGEARDKLFANEITLQEFYNVRNRTWYELADAQASRWRVATREVIFTGEKEKFPTKLKWTEPAFNLGEFELLRPVQQGERTFWYARSVEDGSVHKFLDPMDKGGALPQVPQSVINDYNRMTGELDKLVDTVAEGLPMVDVEGQAAAAAEKEAADFLASYTLDAKKQLSKWFNIQGDGIKDLYKAITETNNGRAALGGTWQPGMGDYADYMNRRTERARRLIIQNIEAIMKGGPNTLSPQQRLRAFDAMVAVARQYDGVLGTAAKAAEDTANFAMLNYADRRNLDNIIGMWTSYHFFFTRTAKNWMERSILKPSLLAAYYKTKKAADQYADQNNLPERLRGKVYVGNWGGEDRYIPNPIEIMLSYNVYGLKGFDDPEEASNGWERAYMYAQMLGFGALPVYDAAIKWASGKGDTIQIGDYIPQYRALNYLYQSVTGQSLPSAGDEFDPYRTGRAAGLMAIQGKTSPTLAQWAQDIAYQVMNGVDALPEQPKQAQAVYEAAAKAAGWDVALARLGSFFLGTGIYTYTDAEKAAREAQKTYHSLAYSEDGNTFGSREAMNASKPDWYSAWQSKASLAPGASESNPNGEVTRPGAIASFNEMSAAKDQLNAQQNGEIDKFILDQTAAGTPIAEIQSEVWKIIKRYSNQRDGIEAAHPSAALPSSDNPYYGYNPRELGARAYEDAVRKAQEQMGDMPDYPKDGTTEQKRAWVEAKQQYDQRLLSLVNGYMQDPSSLVGGNKVDTSKLPTDPADVIKMYDQRYMTPIQKQLADAVAAEKAAKAQEFGKYNQNWNEYNGLGDDYDAKRKYLQEHPEFAAYLAARYKGKGYDAWWLKERKQGGRSYGGGGGRRGGGGGGRRSYGGGAPTDYSNLFPSIAAWAQRTPKAPGVSSSINPILWQMTGRRYGSK